MRSPSCPPVGLRVVIVAAVVALAAAVSFPAPAVAAAGPDPEIAALQVALRSKGMYFGKIDGLAGPSGLAGPLTPRA